MDASILTTIKKLLGIEETDTSFDVDIIIFINSAIARLTELGVGPADGYQITDSTEKWSDYLGLTTKVGDIQTYIYYSVRLSFDPPTSSFVLDSMQKQLDKLEWNINVNAEGGSLYGTVEQLP